MNTSYSFKNDYSEGAHPRIMDALQKYNAGQEEGYGRDKFCTQASQLICHKIDLINASVHFVAGGTQANLVVLSALLRPYESVIAAASAHIATHETGAIEAIGHKINLVPTIDGKLTAELVDEVIKKHQDEHMVKPRAVFISQTTEYGTIYSKQELTKLFEYCKNSNLYLYLDGARLAVSLTAATNDLSLKEIAKLVDVFYIGGTKNGAFQGEAIVITNPLLAENFRYVMKQKGALLAKSRIFGIQFLELFKDDLFLELGILANNQASILAEGIQSEGYKFHVPPTSNQIFPIFPNTLIEYLQTKFDFHVWEQQNQHLSVVRLVTSWATNNEAIANFLAEMKNPG